MTPEQISKEVERTEAIVAVSEQIIRNTDVQLKAVGVLSDHGERFRGQLPMLTNPERPAPTLAALPRPKE